MVNSNKDEGNIHETNVESQSKRSRGSGPSQLSFNALMNMGTSSKSGNKSSKSEGFSFPNVSLRSILLNPPFGQKSKSRRPCTNAKLGASHRPNSPSPGADEIQTYSLTRKGSSSPSNSKSSTLLSKDADKSSQSALQSIAGAESAEGGTSLYKECPICLHEFRQEELPVMSTCQHLVCLSCMQQYLTVEISESRTNINCPECSELMHPTDIHRFLNNPVLSQKFEDFMLRRVLSVNPDTRWCPAPDCGYAVIASECASCPKLECEREGCETSFCYHCKATWHPNQTCDMARAKRSPKGHYSTYTYLSDLHYSDEVKSCPRCQVLIVKLNDGSCNHMTCSVCNSEFCWLCMKEISDLHYLSPSGCTFWGKKPWSRKKKILWQLGTLVGAPLGIGLIAGLALPAVVIGIPIWVGRKLHTRYAGYSKKRRNLFIVGGVTLSALVSPLLAGLSIGIGVPILLAYVYGVVPVSLCRSRGCGVTTSSSGLRIAFENENDMVISIPGRAESSRDMQMYEFQSMSDLSESARTDSHKSNKGVDVHAYGGAGKLSIFSVDSTSLAPSDKSTVDGENASTKALAGSLSHYTIGDSIVETTQAVLEDTAAVFAKCGQQAASRDDYSQDFTAFNHTARHPRDVPLPPKSVVIDIHGLGQREPKDTASQPLLHKHKSSEQLLPKISLSHVAQSKSQPELRN